MSNLKLPILNATNSNFETFIDYWSKLYIYPLEHLYNGNISKKTFEVDDIQDLMKWKNGMNLSSQKQKSVDEKIIPKIDIINDLKKSKDFKIEDVNKEFDNLSFVWKIFILHIIKPKSYPIYDQHINRAYNFITGKEYRSISHSISDKKKEIFYFGEYLPFIKELNYKPLKKLDEAFFTFGKFIKTQKYYKIF